MVLEKYFFKALLSLTATLLFVSFTCAQNIVRYHLTVTDTQVTWVNKTKRGIAVNGQIPMPTLVFTQGDTAEITVHNLLKESTSLHWHGLILPNKEDGVPYLTQLPIPPGATHVYRFPIVQHGTHWYHSHSGLQEQIGMYGSMVLLKKKDSSYWRRGIDDLPEIPVVLSEWTQYKPENIHRMLHNANDWFAIKKNAVQSYGEALRAGYAKTKLKNEWKRMLAMDVSDIYYDKILVNGQATAHWTAVAGKALVQGEKVRLRVSNAGASSYFWLQYGGGKITIVATDGNDVEPVEVDRLLIGVSETYDLVVKVPKSDSAAAFVATTEDRTNKVLFYLGAGPEKDMPPLPRLHYFEGMKMMNSMMKMNGQLDDMGMQMSLNQMDMNVVMYPEITGNAGRSKKANDPSKYQANNLSDFVTFNYAMLRSPEKTTLPEGPEKTLFFSLTGNMNRYVWSMDNKVVSEADRILIKKGERVKLILYNGSMMRHPMHLHGHDFRVLNGQGDHAPMKNTIDIMPMETDTLEFQANNTGDWFFHCHILYHMMSGMGRIFSYDSAAPNPNLPNPKWAARKLAREDRVFHWMAENDFATNGNDGETMWQNTRWSMGTEWRLGYNSMHGYETETHIGRYLGTMQWLMPFIGFDWRYRKMGIDGHEKNIFGQTNTKDNRAVLSLGVNYTLPLLIRFQTEIFSDGNLRLQLMREDIPLTKRMRGAFMVNSDKEYMMGLQYLVSRTIGLRVHYDSDMGLGLGLGLRY